MKSKLLRVLALTTLVAASVVMLTGCGDKEDTKKKENNSADNNTVSITNNVSNNTASDNEEEITKELPEGSSLFVTNVIDNGDTYTLEGVLYEEYIVSSKELNEAVKSGKITIDGETFSIEKEDDDDIEIYNILKGEDARYSIRKHEDSKYHLICLAQIPTCQRKTDKKKKITISKSVKCESIYTEEEESVKDTFSKFKKQDAPDVTHPIPSYTFEFKNGKCSKVLVDTGL